VRANTTRPLHYAAAVGVRKCRTVVLRESGSSLVSMLCYSIFVYGLSGISRSLAPRVPSDVMHVLGMGLCE